MTNLIINDLNQDTIVDFKDCFDKNGNFKRLDDLRWQYFDNPEKRSIVDIAKDSETGKTAAIYAIACIKLKINGKLLQCGQSMDTITDADYRGTGLFINLANDVYEKAEKSLGIIYGFPNGNSFKGFRKHLKWTILDPVPFLIKPLRSQYFTKKIKAVKFLPNINLSSFSYRPKKEYSIKEEKFFPIEVTGLWNRFSKDIKVTVNRDKDYLDWRYIRKPNVDYKIAHCYKKKEYLGFVVYAVKEKHGGRIAYIMELVYDPDEKAAGENLLKYAVSKIKKQKADCILSWCFEHSSNYSVYRKVSFFNLPEKFRPIELHFGARSFNPDFDASIMYRNNWYISYSDSDTV